MKYTPGTLEETLAIAAYQKNQELEFLKTKLLVDAILLAGGNIISALTQSSGGSSAEDFKKTYEIFRDEMCPHLVKSKERDLARAKKVMETEMHRGPLTIQVMTNKKKKKQR